METTDKAKTLGRVGENYAAKWLQLKKGYRVVARNVHAQGGELDIVAYDWRNRIYILVEVKTRSSQSFVLGIESVGPQKQHKMQKAAADFFLRKRGFSEVPEFEIHAMVLIPKTKKLPWQPAFEVDYYDDLS